jgi:D-hexose-6-phosphate mutarotase
MASSSAKQNSLTTVVWAWAESTRHMSDLATAVNFACVEASNVGEYAVHLAPGKEHVMSVVAQVGSL